MAEVKLFGKWSFEEVKVGDVTIEKYINLKPIAFPMTFGRRAGRRAVPKNIVERLINKLIRGGTGEKIAGKVIRTHGRLQAPKLKIIGIVRRAFDAIFDRTKENPIQILVRAVENTAPREETTRVEYGGIMYQVAVDVAPRRRVDVALRNIALAALIASFDKKTTLEEALANELILAAKGDPGSYAIKRRDEIERIARSAR